MSLFLRNLFFTILQPGLVTILFPYFIINQTGASFPVDISIYHIAGIILFIIGLVILLICIFRLAIKGKGTLSPLDPTTKLVISGMYKYSRNPMYVGAMIMLIGESIIFQSTALWIYAIIVFVAFNLFIWLHEEPRLSRDFGDEYREYRHKVRRWI